jgi:lipoate-protein ligase A
MHYLDLTLPTLAENLALDEALLLDAEDGPGGEVLRVWEWTTPAVVLGSGCVICEDVNEPRCAADGVLVLRRASGGGTVLLGQGCLCYGLVLAYESAIELREIRSSYRYILGRVGVALAGLLPEIEHAGTSDLAAAGRKVSGNSQQRKRGHLLHHGTLLCGFDSALVGRYLHLPQRQPNYRAGRGHAAFLTSLPAGTDELKKRLRAAWSAEFTAPGWPVERTRQLVESKYLRPDWVRRR